MYIIVNAANLYWSNQDGWTNLSCADTFSALERETLRLPLGGMWAIKP